MNVHDALYGYTAHPDFVDELARELQMQTNESPLQIGRIFFTPQKLQPLWCHNHLRNVETHTFQSISEAQKILKAKAKFWHLHPGNAVRRSKLIQDGLPKWKIKPLSFLGTLPTIPLGTWTLKDENTLLLSADCSSVFPDGEMIFAENKTEPPSRAYLKLWEFFTLHQVAPKKGSTCIDLGSAPGGWTWVLDTLDTKIWSVDKADLELKKPSAHITKITKDAFAVKPESIGPVDWLCSDLICYPDRLYDLVQEWRQSGLVKNFVCTIKFQGDTDYRALERFKAIPGSSLQHLWWNKHEVTWSLLDKNRQD